MADQYMRKVSLVLGNGTTAIDVSALRIKFQVKQWDIQTPNSLTARVYNLADQTAQQVQEEFTRVVLQAGYEGNYGVIFDGQIVQARRGRENATDTYLDILAADGDAAYNFAVLNRSFAGGSSARDRVIAAIDAMQRFGVHPAYVAELPDQKLPRGKVMFGMARDELRNLAETTGASWSIQDQGVNFLPITGVLPGPAVVLTSKTGMIGLPEQTADGIKVRCLLNPQIKAARAVQIDNRSIQRAPVDIRYTAVNWLPKVTDDGFYRSIVVDHVGDTRGNDFYSDLICVSLDDTVTPGLIAKGYG